MKKIAIVATTMLIALMFVSVLPFASAQRGPRSDLDIIWYENADMAFTALQSGEIDMLFRNCN